MSDVAAECAATEDIELISAVIEDIATISVVTEDGCVSADIEKAGWEGSIYV